MSGSLLIRVTTAHEAAARDAAAIAAGTPSSTLMERAGMAAAAEIARRYPSHLASQIAVYAGPGNNGGDGYVVARELARRGAKVRVIQVEEPRTPDAIAARNAALATKGVKAAADDKGATLIIDALLGTGSSGEPRGAIAAAIRAINRWRSRDDRVVSLDVPSGLDADGGGAGNPVHADLTLTFGTIKRGLLMARDIAGAIVLLEIGLGSAGDADGAPVLMTAAWVRMWVPPIPASSHKGTRKKLAIVGGQLGMAGAPMLAARAAMRSGIGMVRLVVAPENIPVVQSAVPLAMAAAWPKREEEVRDAITDWADCVLLGPGLGDSPQSLELAQMVLAAWRGPVVVDADGLNVFKRNAAGLGELLAGRPALLTPHAAECARLLDMPVAGVLAQRYEIGGVLSKRAHAAVLFKGVPTIISGEHGERLVSATGTPVLAAAGSGDLLSGIAAALLAQMGSAVEAGACAAWAHGRAAELVGTGRTARGVTLDQVESALSSVWALPRDEDRPPVLAELPFAGEPR
jgi:NAD(P)H-hydrate epimerase